jgi:alkylhydroperoxidase family enzyme
MLAHGALLRKNFFSTDELAAIVKDYHHAGLTDEEVTLMSFAKKVISGSRQISQEDMDELRRFGLTDEDILNVVLVCTARSFFSKTLDALAAEPDEVYAEFDPELLKLLTPGRPFTQPLVKEI